MADLGGRISYADEFPFLIGTSERDFDTMERLGGFSLFPFLIGTSEREYTIALAQNSDVFPFLIGTSERI